MNMRHGSRGMVMALVVGAASIGLVQPAKAGGPEICAKTVNDLSRYMATCWRNARVPADAWDDCTQEVLARLLKSVPGSRWSDLLKGEGDDRQEFLRAIDAVKKRQQRSKRYTELPIDVADYRANSSKTPFDRERVVQVAEEHLSDRQRKILQLLGEGWQVNAIADEMAMPESRVSDEKYKAIRKLRKHLDVA